MNTSQHKLQKLTKHGDLEIAIRLVSSTEPEELTPTMACKLTI